MKPCQFLYIDEVEQIIGKHRNTIRRWANQGCFPKGVKTPGGELCWRVQTILEWVDKMSAGHFN